MSPLAMVAAPLAALLGFQRPAPRERALALALAALVIWSLSGSSGSFEVFERTWVLLLTGGLVLALALRPPSDFGVVSTSLVAVAAAGVAAAALVWATAYSWDELRWAAGRHFGAQVRLVVGALAAATGQGAGEAGGAAASAAQLVGAFETSAVAMTRWMSELVPGLVLLQSLAALSFAWAIYRRVARHPEGAGLPPLREFRFNDHLIWGAVLALMALVVPGLAWSQAVGGNLAVFFGGLYVVRGLGIVLAAAAAGGLTGPVALMLGLATALFLLPVAALVALTLGVSDTWVDWRRLLRAATRQR